MYFSECFCVCHFLGVCFEQCFLGLGMFFKKSSYGLGKSWHLAFVGYPPLKKKLLAKIVLFSRESHILCICWLFIRALGALLGFPRLVDPSVRLSWGHFGGPSAVCHPSSGWSHFKSTHIRVLVGGDFCNTGMALAKSSKRLVFLDVGKSLCRHMAVGQNSGTFWGRIPPTVVNFERLSGCSLVLWF